MVYNFVNQIDKERFSPFVLTNKESELTDELQKSGYEFEIIPQNDRIGNQSDVTVKGGWLGRLLAARDVFAYNNVFGDLLDEKKCDVLWVRNIKAVLMSGWAARKRNIPLVWDIGMEKTSKGLVRHLHNIGFGLVDKVVTESSCVAKSIFTDKQVAKYQSKLTVVKSGIPEDRVKSIHDAVANPAEKNGRFNIINIASVCARKNQQMVVKAILPLLESHPEILVSFVGPFTEEEYYEQTKKMIEDESADKHFQFLGWRNDATELLANSDLFVLSSHIEGVPYSILEAMHAKVPVVATDCGGVPDVILDEKTGFLIQRDDDATMSQRIGVMIKDRGLARQLAGTANQFVLENHTAEKWCHSYMDLLDSLISKRHEKQV